MKRYIVSTDILQHLPIETIDAFELRKDFKVTDEAFHFNNLPYISVILSDEQVTELTQLGVTITEQHIQKNPMLGWDYQKVHSKWVKPQKRFYTGRGCKVAILDTGCTEYGTQGVDAEWRTVDFKYNFADDNTDITDTIGHGSYVTSMVKSHIGLAPDCELHFLKVYSGSTIDDTTLLEAIDYCITNEIDVVNMSFQYASNPIEDAIETMIAAGIVVVAASGNSTTDTFTVFPAAIPGVIAVNAIPESGEPVYKNINVFPGYHGITVACSGWMCEGVSSAGAYNDCYGTSFACPFAAGVFACYHQQYAPVTDNHALMDYIISKSIKTPLSNYFGAGIISF